LSCWVFQFQLAFTLRSFAVIHLQSPEEDPTSLTFPEEFVLVVSKVEAG